MLTPRRAISQAAMTVLPKAVVAARTPVSWAAIASAANRCSGRNSPRKCAESAFPPNRSSRIKGSIRNEASNSFASATTPWVEVRVQSVQEQEECRYLGCAFVRSPTWEVLMQFG